MSELIAEFQLVAGFWAGLIGRYIVLVRSRVLHSRLFVMAPSRIQNESRIGTSMPM